ncbi:MAG: T9SS type A sorting domain-containing protein [Phycisphaerae bacterium]|nr:T9SS type A sorting domain-containing protein [Saprospiraceae bacterium]
MKSLILTFSLAVELIFSLSAQVNIPQPTHLIVQIAPAPGMPFTKDKEEFYYLDNNGNPYQSKTNTWDGSNWMFSTRGYYTLNAEGKPTEILERKWDMASSTLIDSKRTTIAYETDGQENYRKIETWNTSLNVWEPGIIQTTSFTPDNKVLEFTYESFNAGMQLFGSRETYTYSGGQISELVGQIWENGIWSNRNKSDFVYNGSDGEYDTILTRNWDEADSSWAEVNFRRTQTVTDTQTVVISEYLLGGVWMPTNLIRTKYDSNKQILEKSQESWEATSMVWIVQFRDEYAYNADQSILQFKVSFRDNNVGILHLFIVVDYDYGSYPVSTVGLAREAKMSISPNPAADFVDIQMEGNETSKISLFDMRGNMVAQTSTAANIAHLLLANLDAGTYFLRVEQGAAIKVLSVVKN